MYWFPALSLVLLTWLNQVNGDCDSSIVSTLLEEVMALKDTVSALETKLELDILELQLTSSSCTCESTEEITSS